MMKRIYSVGTYLAVKGEPTGVHWFFETGCNFTEIVNKVLDEFKFFRDETIEKLIIKTHDAQPK